ncbi:MAG: NAD(P)-binding domain-containing protein, partial [Thermoproteota archaeon]
DAIKASQAALEYSKNATDLYGSVKGKITGNDNVSIAKESDVLVLSIPYENIDSTCPDILSNIKDSCIVISPIVPMTKTNSGFEFISFIEKKPSAFETVQKHMKDKTKLIAAFHTVSEKKLTDPNLILDFDIFICGDDQKSIEIVSGLVREIKNLRPLILGPGSLSYLAEVATPILLNIMIKNKMKNPGLKIV